MEPSQPKRRRPSNLPPITRELIFATCEQLKGAKASVTNQAVRNTLGGGSYLTISPWVKEWQDQEDQRFRLSLTEIPEEVEDEVVLAAQKIWKVASDRASQQLIELGKRMQEMEATHLRQVQEYHAEIEGLESDRDAIAGERDALTSQAQEHIAATEAVRTELADIRNKLTIALLREQEMERQKTLMEKERNEARSDAEKISKDYMKLEAHLELAQTDRERAEEMLKMAQKSIRDFSDQVTSLQQKLAVEQQKSRGLYEQSLQLKDQVETERENNAKARQGLQEQLETERNNNIKNQQALEDMQTLHKAGLDDLRTANASAIARAERAESTAKQLDEIRRDLEQRFNEQQNSMRELQDQLAIIQKRQHPLKEPEAMATGPKKANASRKGATNEAPTRP